jgi:hypothetical protein
MEIPVILFNNLFRLRGYVPARGGLFRFKGYSIAEVLSRAATEDRQGIEELIKEGHLSRPTLSDQEVVVTLVEESLVEFSFISNPANYWTLAKFLAGYAKPTYAPLPYNQAPLNAEPSPTPPLPAPMPCPSPVLTEHGKHPRGGEEDDSLPPLDTEGGKKACRYLPLRPRLRRFPSLRQICSVDCDLR